MNIVKLEFELGKKEIPINYNEIFISFIKNALSSLNKEYFESIYLDGARMKGFTFSVYLPDAKFKGDVIKLSKNRATMYFSSCDKSENVVYPAAFKLMKDKRLPLSEKNFMVLKDISYQTSIAIEDSEIEVSFLSSLLVRIHDKETNQDRYLTVDDDDFEEGLKLVIDKFIETGGLDLTTEGFSITPIKAKKIVARVFGRPRDASIGNFKITGSPELLNVLKDAGIGSRRSSGHGQFRILK